MSIEIRQLSIKSNVIQQAAGSTCNGADSQVHPGEGDSDAQDNEEMRSDILSACKEMVLDLLSRSRER